ncbi:MAG: NAD(P)/FAD-dependent oxidoreductase, partial [Verrucomicrobiales bacterium]
MAKGVKTITVIGGGLAGLSLGIGLRRAGIPVELHEASNYPRHRVCGEFISGLGAETVKALGLETALEGCLEHQSSVWFVRGKRIFSGRLPVAARAISRFELDMRLMELFVDLGGRMHQRSRFMEEDGEGLVWAAGRQRVRASTWVGLKAHFLKVPMAEGLEMHLGDGLYIGLTLIEGERVNVCGLMRGPINIAKKGSDMLLELMRLRGLGELAERLG